MLLQPGHYLVTMLSPGCNNLVGLLSELDCTLLIIALAVFTRSPSAYQALQGFGLLQLPSIRTLKSYIDANLEKAGDSIERLKQARKIYQSMVAEVLKKNEELKSKLMHIHVHVCNQNVHFQKVERSQTMCHWEQVY